jgi:hypothetical protein
MVVELVLLGWLCIKTWVPSGLFSLCLSPIILFIVNGFLYFVVRVIPGAVCRLEVVESLLCVLSLLRGPVVQCEACYLYSLYST